MTELGRDLIQQIDQILLKFPADQRQSAVISALMLVQKRNNGWLTTELMDQVADYLGMPRIEVYEVASFYTMFDLAPVGRHKIYLCTSVSCMLRGSEELADHLRAKLGIDFNQTTPDGKFTLKSAECLAGCGGSPMLQLDDTYYENLTSAKLDALLAEAD